ncbi:addiction module toxin RelE [Aeromonas sp. A35_P]|uniref:type II toxin-antitoxin system HigB family toxin n=1 Tax=Aeromonas sp. A35_P TaxID=1983805 RepID=UPI000B9BCC18|nr:type II toxin-antitoxin system HigB family toxin [Aeromonas sp. A35_P]OZG42980.1 addiction module toxin RelE [Aeromonas sp. A35_P]
MRVLAKPTLEAFWTVHPDAEQPLKSWYDEARKATWATPQDIKDVYRSASFVGNDRVVFNIAGNKYRLVVGINYPIGIPDYP